MNGGDLLHIFEYDEWATNALFDAAAQLSAEQAHKDLGTSFQSVHGTLLHICRGQAVWLSRWKGSAVPPPTAEEAPTIRDLQQRWRELHQDLRAHIRSLNDEQLRSNLTYRDPSGKEWSHPLFQQIEHLTLHSMYHRGQVVTLLRQLGQTPPHTDLIVYCRLQIEDAARKSTASH